MIAGGPSDLEQGAHWQLEILGAELCLGQELINWGGGKSGQQMGQTPVAAEPLESAQESEAEPQS